METTDLTREVIELSAFIGGELGYREEHRGSVGNMFAEHTKRLDKIEEWRDGNGKMGAKTMLILIFKTYVWAYGILSFVAGATFLFILGKVMPNIFL